MIMLSMTMPLMMPVNLKDVHAALTMPLMMAVNL
jgi:hypothetical protein